MQGTRRSLEAVAGRRGGAEWDQTPIGAKERMERRAKRAKRSLEPRWGGAEPSGAWNQIGEVAKRRETWSRKSAKVRIVTGCYAMFHESSHRSGPWLRDCSDYYGWDQFLDANSTNGREFNNEDRK